LHLSYLPFDLTLLIKLKLKTIIYQSSKIFYRTIGNGRLVVLIHGFAEDGEIWKNQIEFLQQHFTLLIPDLPGSGQSSMIQDMSIDGMAEVIKYILDKEKMEACTMLGHSMGGYITLAFAEKYLDNLVSFGLVHSTAFADSEEKKTNRLKSIVFVKKNGAFEFLKAVITDLFTENWYVNNSKFVNELIEKSRNFKDEAIIAYYQAMINRPDRTKVLKTTNKPVLFVIGEHDKAVPFKQSLQQCHLPVQSSIQILRNSAHMGMWEEAGKLNSILKDFS